MDQQFCIMVKNSAVPVQTPQVIAVLHKESKQEQLAAIIIRLSFFNLLVVSLIGVLLRAFPFLSRLPFDHKNLLHGHSHFAFGGWVMPMLLALLLKTFSDVTTTIAYKHWRNITMLLFVSAYGM